MTQADEQIQRNVNVREAMKVLAIKTGKYALMCRAYSMKKVDDRHYELVNPKLKYDFDSEMMPLLESICGPTLGENPHHPNHPVRTWKGGYR